MIVSTKKKKIMSSKENQAENIGKTSPEIFYFPRRAADPRKRAWEPRGTDEQRTR